MLIHICKWSTVLWDRARTPWLWWQQCALVWNGSEEVFYTAAAGGAPACPGLRVLPSTQGLPCSASPAKDISGWLGTVILVPGTLQPEPDQSTEVFTQPCSMELLHGLCRSGCAQDTEKSGASRS